MILSNTRLRQRAGFTLIELMVVMVILVLLASVVTMIFVNRIEDAKHAKAVADVETIGSAMDQFYLHCQRYPTSEEGLEALRTKPQADDMSNWNGPYIKKAVPKDPWGRDYVYRSPGDHNPDSFDLSSLGKDGQEGGTGNNADVTNWE